MNDELSEALSKASFTQLTLENLRDKNLKRALELLEVSLDASVLALNRLAKDAEPAERQRAILFLRQIRAYRQLYPRQVEADLDATLARSGREAEVRVRKILDEVE